MAKFNWDKFKSGKLSVILRTKELAEDFYKECKKHGINWGSCDYAIWQEGGVQYEYYAPCKSLVWGNIKHITGDSIEWKGSEKMGKTFREVIADIKPGEVWESDIKIIKCTNDGNISVRSKIDGKTEIMNFNKCNLYRLQRKEYTFEEAFKAYEKGKEIESKDYKYKKIDGIDCFKTSMRDEWTKLKYGISIELKEIRDTWYIND